MAWYRAGGGGIPSSLKTDMNDVLNKKFGTSVDYPPTDWAPTVNLMGPLPEKTASGAIVTFPDGADAVPLKKCEITLPASLDGYSEIDVVSAGKNLINVTTFENKAIGADGTITNANTRLLSPILRLKSGTYFINFPSGNTFIGFAEYNGDTWVRNVFTNNSVGISIQPQTDSFRLYFKRNDNGDMTPSDISTAQLEAGNQQTAHVPYTAPTTHTASLGRTIHGGTADVVKGEGENTHAKISDFSTLRANGTSSTGAYRYIIDVSGMGDYNVGACVSNLLTYRVSYNANVGEFYNTTNVLIIFLAQDNAQDAITYLQSNSCEIAYPLATPETFTFDHVPIDSKLGNNTVWSEQGSAEVTYRADINLALGGQ